MWRIRVLLSGVLLFTVVTLSEGLFVLGLPQAAASVLRRSIQTSRHFKVELGAQLASMYERMGRIDEAIERLNQIAQTDPNAVFFLELGLMYEKNGQPQLAVTNLERSMRLEPNIDPEFRSWMETKIDQLKFIS